jgi:transcriptional regulator with XRE-family HTH domain
MISDIFATPFEVAILIAKAAKNKRLSLNLSQKSLSERSGVSYGVIKKFERTGKISLESLLKLALILGSLTEFTSLFKQTTPEEKRTIDEIIQSKRRKRGRN